MNIFVQTRGITKDYQFLGKSPENSWWMNYKDYTSFENPTVILESIKPEDWRLYLSGMTCSRFDKVNTPIRYTFVLESNDKCDNDKKFQKILSLIQLWITAIYEMNTKDELKNKLNDLFTVADIERFLLISEDIDIYDEVIRRFDNWFDNCFFNVEINLTENNIYHKSYYGSLQNSKNEFLLNCKNIFDRKNKFSESVFYLNYIEKIEEIESSNLLNTFKSGSRFFLLINDDSIKTRAIETKSDFNILSKNYASKPKDQKKKRTQLMVMLILIVIFLTLIYHLSTRWMNY